MNRTADAVGLLTWLVTDPDVEVTPSAVADGVRIACDVDPDDPVGRVELFATVVATIARVPSYAHVAFEELLPSRGNLLTLLECSGDGAPHLLAEHDDQLARLTRTPAVFRQQLALLVERTVEVLRDLDDGLRVLSTLGSLSQVVEISERAVEDVFTRHDDEHVHDLLHVDLPRGPVPPGDPARGPQLRAGARLLRRIVHAHNLGAEPVAFDAVDPASAAGALVAGAAVHVAVRQVARGLQEEPDEEEIEELDHLGPPGEDLFPLSLLATLVAAGHDEHASLWRLADQLAAGGTSGVCARLEAGFCTYGGDLDELVVGPASGFAILLAGLDAAAEQLEVDLDPRRLTFDLDGADARIEGARTTAHDVDDASAAVLAELDELDPAEVRRRLRRLAVDPVAARWILENLL